MSFKTCTGRWEICRFGALRTRCKHATNYCNQPQRCCCPLQPNCKHKLFFFCFYQHDVCLNCPLTVGKSRAGNDRYSLWLDEMIEESLSFHPVSRVGKCANGDCASLQFEQKISREGIQLLMSQMSGLLSSFFFHTNCVSSQVNIKAGSSTLHFDDTLLLQCDSELLRNQKSPHFTSFALPTVLNIGGESLFVMSDRALIHLPSLWLHPERDHLSFKIISLRFSFSTFQNRWRVQQNISLSRKLKSSIFISQRL